MAPTSSTGRHCYIMANSSRLSQLLTDEYATAKVVSIPLESHSNTQFPLSYWRLSSQRYSWRSRLRQWSNKDTPVDAIGTVTPVKDLSDVCPLPVANHEAKLFSYGNISSTYKLRQIDFEWRETPSHGRVVHVRPCSCEDDDRAKQHDANEPNTMSQAAFDPESAIDLSSGAGRALEQSWQTTINFLWGWIQCNSPYCKAMRNSWCEGQQYSGWPHKWSWLLLAMITQ